MTTALSTRGLSKDFRGFRATDNVNLDVTEGEIHAIIGPNGAGKTTLFNLLSGHLKPSAGEVLLYGRNISSLPPEVIVRLGLSRSFQISSVFSSLSVLDNLLVALQSPSALPGQFWRSDASILQFEGRARELLDLVDLAHLADRPAGDLSHGEKRHLEIALTLTQDPKVLLLDEPTSGMGSEGVTRVIRLVREVARGRTVVLVEHNMSVVSELADRITVLQYGSILASGTYDEVRSNPKVIEAYLGEEAA